MRKLKNAIVRYHIFHKRLLLRPGFLCLLAMVPIVGILLGLVAGMDSGVVTIFLASDEESVIASEIISSLEEDAGIIHFVSAEPDEAIDKVRLGEADAAWIFMDGLDERIESFAENNAARNAFVKVYQREDDVTLMLAREKLCGAVYPYASRQLYLDYVRSNVTSEYTHTELLYYYDAVIPEGSELFEVTFADGSSRTDKESVNYLSAPLRGLLSVMVVLSGLALSMFYKIDEERGLFTHMGKGGRLLFAFGYHFAGVLDIGAAVILSLTVAGVNAPIFREILMMILLAVATVLFCMLIGSILPRLGALCALTPLLVIGMLIICPVFFNIGFLQPVQLLFPPYYYLNGIYNDSFVLWMIIYIALMALTNIFIACVRFERRNRA